MTILNREKEYKIRNAQVRIQTALLRAQEIVSDTAGYQRVHVWVHTPSNTVTTTSSWRRPASPGLLHQFPDMRIRMKMLRSYPWRNACSLSLFPLIHTFAVCSWHCSTQRRRGWGVCLLFPRPCTRQWLQRRWQGVTSTAAAEKATELPPVSHQNTCPWCHTSAPYKNPN